MNSFEAEKPKTEVPLIHAAYVGISETVPVSVGVNSTDVRSPKVSIGAKWNADTVAVSVLCDVTERVCVRLDGCEKTAEAVCNGQKDFVFAVSEIGRTRFFSGIELPLTVEAKKTDAVTVFDGGVLLCSYETVIQNPRFFAPKVMRYDVARDYFYPDDIACRCHGSATADNTCLHLLDPAENAIPYYRLQVDSEPLPAPLFTEGKTRVDFDLCFSAMPVYQREYHTVKIGYGFSVVLADPTPEGQRYGSSVMLCFFNTDNGICVYSNTRSLDDISDTVNIGKQLGEQFHVGLISEGRSVTLLIDGNETAIFENAKLSRSLVQYNNTEKPHVIAMTYGSRSVSFVWQRTGGRIDAQDGFEAEIEHISVGFAQDISVADGFDITEGLPGHDSDTGGVYVISSNLDLPSTFRNEKYGVTFPILWSSSDEGVMTSKGEIKHTESVGKCVNLTAGLSYDGKTDVRKTFRLFVQSPRPLTRVLIKSQDVDPITGAGELGDCLYRADCNHNSVIYDMGREERINRAELRSLHSGSRVTRNFTALYASHDNRTYVPISNFSMLQRENTLYFYNFSVKARYLKIHFTYGDHSMNRIAIIHSLQKMMQAYYSDQPLLARVEEFAHRTSIAVENSLDHPVYDKVVRYTLSEIGIHFSELNEEHGDIRFRLGEWELPFYEKDGVCYIRIPEIPAKASVTVDVFYGNASAESVSDGVSTFEIEYGNKIETSIGAGTWITTVEQMPDGSFIIIGKYPRMEHLGIQRSYDGGRTWSLVEEIQYTTEYITDRDRIDDSGGFIVDRENNVVYFFCFHTVELLKKRTVKVLVSTDSGKTWEIRTLDNLPADVYCNSYSDGLKLSTYDGDGENVDYVFTLSVKCAGSFSFVGTALYSKDNGKTWQLSESRIDCPAPYERKFECGVGEDTVWEKQDGTLIFYSRCQMENSRHFAVSHSYDHGVTWEEKAQLSNVYAPYTQPIVDKLNGVPVLMWGGNNSLGAYQRFPFNLAYSADDGESFLGMQDISFQLNISNREYVRRLTHYEITNPDIVFFRRGDADCAFILCMQARVLIEHIGDYLYKTKGAFDSFENGSAEADGWVSVSGARPILTTLGATDGKYAMCLRSNSMVSRSVPYLKKGHTFFDLYVKDIRGGLHIELQSAYHRDIHETAPISLYADAQGCVWYYGSDGEQISTGLRLLPGNNTVSIAFDGTAAEAALTVNGQSCTVEFCSGVGDYICFAYLHSGIDSCVAVDRFAVVDDN